MPIPDPNKPEQHEGWCPLGETNLSQFFVHYSKKKKIILHLFFNFCFAIIC